MKEWKSDISGVKVFCVNVDESCGGFGDESSTSEIDVNRPSPPVIIPEGRLISGIKMYIRNIRNRIRLFVSLLSAKSTTLCAG